MDCNKYCSSILYEQNAILVEIKKLEAEHRNKTYSREARNKYENLDQQRDKLQEDHTLCMMDCKKRKGSHSKEEQIPIPPPPKDLIEQLNELTDDIDGLDGLDGGGNKRRPRDRRLHRRRSFRNRTHRRPRQTRRNQRRNTRRRNGRNHRTRSDRK